MAATVGIVDQRDDELDWLYRRGRYGEDTPDADRTRTMPSGERATAPRPSPTPAPRPAPTPVAHPAPTPVGAVRAPRTRRRLRPRRVVGLLLLLSLVYLVAVPAITWSRMEKVDATPSGARPGNQPGSLYVLAGSDSREGLTPGERTRLGTGSIVGRRTDTIMLLYVPPGGKSALISVPRDSYVTIPGHGENKINASYAIGGPELLVATIESSTGLRVDGYAEIGFGGFVEVIDAVGGITMCLDAPINDRDAHLNLPAGCQLMDGVTALGYVRMRKSDPRGDLGRVERQREMIGAVVRKAATPWSVLNPVRYWRLNAAGARALATGEGTGLNDVGRIGFGVVGASRGDGLTLTIPVANADAATQAGSAVLWDEEKAAAMFREIARGDTSKLSRFRK